MRSLVDLYHVSPSLLQLSSHSILDPQLVFSFSQLPPLLRTLELDLFFHGHENYMDASGPGGLFNYVLPYLCTLILDHFDLSDPSIAKHFWKVHPGIERLELGPFVKLGLGPLEPVAGLISSSLACFQT